MAQKAHIIEEELAEESHEENKENIKKLNKNYEENYYKFHKNNGKSVVDLVFSEYRSQDDRVLQFGEIKRRGNGRAHLIGRCLLLQQDFQQN